MEKKDIAELKDKVSCAAYLEQDGWKVDVRESTRRAIKYRRGGEILIVIHDGKGWFDPLSDAKGDVFGLAQHLGANGFADALALVAAVVGHEPVSPAWQRSPREKPIEPAANRWWQRPMPRSGSRTWRYLCHERAVPRRIIGAAIQQGCLREGPQGTMWAAHTNGSGAVVGWEERGPGWRGFASGGAKELFRIGPPGADRVCVTEAAIDAMSIAAIDGRLCSSLYVSTGGGWSPATDRAIRNLAARPGALLVAATDANPQGEAFANRLRMIANEADAGFRRMKPKAEDWNAELQMQCPVQ